MPKLEKLNFPAISARLREVDGCVEIWDALRGVYLKCTPEEWVRQHLIAYLVSHCGVHATRIVQEAAVNLNSQPQRADIVVVDGRGQALLLAECKAHNVEISQQTLEQAVRYNSVLKARYIILTNGDKHYCYEVIDGEYRPLKSMPNLAEI